MYKQRIFVIANNYKSYRRWMDGENHHRPHSLRLTPDNYTIFIDSSEKIRGVRGGYFVLLPGCSDLSDFDQIMHTIYISGMEQMTYNKLKGYYDASKTVIDVINMVNRFTFQFSVNGVYNKYD